MTSHREFRRNPKTGQYDSDDAALRDALLDLVEVQVRWRDAVEAIDTARGQPQPAPDHEPV